MINDVKNSTAAYYTAQVTGQTQTNHENNSGQQQVTPHNGRIIEDKIDLSPNARQTLEQRNKARKQEQDILVDEILTKGFRAWSQEKYRERIEAEVRAQVLSSMGLSEEDYASLEAEVQKRIEEIIEEKVREKMQEATEENMAKEGNTIGTYFL